MTRRHAAGRSRIGWRRITAVVLAAASLAGCAGLAPPGAPANAGPAGHDTVLVLDGTPQAVQWVRPSAAPAALVVLAHGFTRRCTHLSGTALALAEAGLASLCLDASMAGGGTPALVEAMATRLLDGADPAGRPWPARVIVAGHSAGAVFALRLGARMVARAPARLAGALLFDPVATADFATVLTRVSDEGRRPVLALLAAPHRCNAQGNAAAPLQEARRLARAAGRDTLRVTGLGPGSTHADVEGDDTDWLAAAACGRPDPARVADLRARAVAWAVEVAAAVPASPGVPIAAAVDGPPPVPVPAGGGLARATIAPCPTCVN